MAPTPTKVLTVTDLTRQIKGLLEDRFPGIWVEGEISNLRTPASGHVYFTLKDARAQLAAVLFRGAVASTTCKPKDGMAVIVHGDVSVYEKQGQYQIIVRQILPKGLGALQLAFQELKDRLQREGLFDAERKRAIPALPQRIGLVTSPTGAAIRDFLNIIGRRYPNLHVIINPVRVQGEGAGEEIAAAIDEFNQLRATGILSVDVLIVTRGGGSLEDLWAFNEEVVARALARSRIPTISAVGHEIDFTIADFVADLRAPTPSAAAELVVRSKQELQSQLEQSQRRLTKELRLRLGELRQRYAALASSHVLRQPVELVYQYQQQLDDLRHRLARAGAQVVRGFGHRWERSRDQLRLLGPQRLVDRWRERLAGQAGRLTQAQHRSRQRGVQQFERLRVQLETLSPKSTLQRGYSITQEADSARLVRSVRSVRPGLVIRTTVLDGAFPSVVSSAESNQ